MLQLEDQLKFIYLELIIRHGKPTGFFSFKTRSNAPGVPPEVVVLYWESSATQSESCFCTLGMSALPMKDQRKCELRFRINDHLDEDQTMAFCRFLANFAIFPFQHNFGINWWNIISDIGPIPVYSNAGSLLIMPEEADVQKNIIRMGEEQIPLFDVVPLTKYESHMIESKGIAQFLNYLEDNRIDMRNLR
jgi:hypothetical protein